jgi:hypothetical protein
MIGVTASRILAMALLAAGLSLAGGAAPAQQMSENRVATKTDWSIFVEGDPPQCWGVSAPRSSAATDRNGKKVTVRRSDIFFYVTFTKQPPNSGEVFFTGGYPFAPGSSVTVEVGSENFTLMTEGEGAWTTGPDQDQALLAAMRKGSEAVVTGTSARGNVTKDTFSLMGFSAAMDEAAKRCQ